MVFYYKPADKEEMVILKPYDIEESYYRGPVYKISMHKEDDPRVGRTEISAWMKASTVECEVYMGRVLWLKERDDIKAEALFKAYRYEQIKKKLKSLMSEL